MLRIRFVILSLILLLCLPSCGKKRRDFASYPLQNPQGIDFEGDPDFVSSYMRYIGVTESQKNPGRGASIFELDSVEELEEFNPVDAGWEIDKIPPGKTELEEFLTDNLDALKSNVADAVKQAKDSFEAVANVTKKSLTEQRDGDVKKRVKKRARGTFRGATSKTASSKSNNNRSTPEITEITGEAEAENVAASNNTQGKDTAFEETDLQSNQSTQNVGELPEPSAEGLPETDDTKTGDSDVGRLEQELMSVDKEENSDPNSRGDSRATQNLDHEKTNHEIAPDQESYGEGESQQDTLKPNAITDTEDSGFSDPSQSESEDDQKSETAEDNQYRNLTLQDGATLETKIEDSSSTESSNSESADDQKKEAVQEKQDGNVAQQDNPLVCTCGCLLCDGVDEREETSRNNIFSAEEDVSQQNDPTVDPCECSCCSGSNEAKEEIQKGIPPMEVSRTVQSTQRGDANCSIEKGVTRTVNSSEILAKILSSLPFCKSECASTLIYSTDPIIENIQGSRSEEQS
ncbi:hypothetical protein ACJZTR_02460 [Neorickettsia risticii]